MSLSHTHAVESWSTRIALSLALLLPASADARSESETVAPQSSDVPNQSMIENAPSVTHAVISPDDPAGPPESADKPLPRRTVFIDPQALQDRRCGDPLHRGTDSVNPALAHPILPVGPFRFIDCSDRLRQLNAQFPSVYLSSDG